MVWYLSFDFGNMGLFGSFLRSLWAVHSEGRSVRQGGYYLTGGCVRQGRGKFPFPALSCFCQLHLLFPFVSFFRVIIKQGGVKTFSKK